MFQWKEVDQNELMDSKLRCVFAMPAGKEENNIESKYEQSQISQPAPSQPAASVKVNTNMQNLAKFKILPSLHAANLQSEG